MKDYFRHSSLRIGLRVLVSIVLFSTLLMSASCPGVSPDWRVVVRDHVDSIIRRASGCINASPTSDIKGCLLSAVWVEVCDIIAPYIRPAYDSVKSYVDAFFVQLALPKSVAGGRVEDVFDAFIDYVNRSAMK